VNSRSLTTQVTAPREKLDTGWDLGFRTRHGRCSSNFTSFVFHYVDRKEERDHIARRYPIQNIVQNLKFVILYRVILTSMKCFKNSQQIDYETDHDNSYADRERNSPILFNKVKPMHIVASFAARGQ
jgi:hypothetical protein